MSNTRPTRSAVRPNGPRKYFQVAWQFLTDATYRAAWVLRWRKPRNLFQANNHTCFDRYPELFRAVYNRLGDAPMRRILSFGCSTGEEVFSLRSYFPTARLLGIDINPANIAACQRQLAQHPDAGIEFLCSDSVGDVAPESLDAVFCLAVFRHGDLIDPRHARCDAYIRFEVFCDLVEQISERLRPGGLLAIAHANFRFCDTPIAARFRAVGHWKPDATTPITPIFDRDNRRTSDVRYDEILFEKIERR